VPQIEVTFDIDANGISRCTPNPAPMATGCRAANKVAGRAASDDDVVEGEYRTV
jgi:molecular chaperone DnaK (HSP70)